MNDRTLPSIDEAIRSRFEAAWGGETRPSIADFLPPADHPTFLPTLEELVCIDLEFSMKRTGAKVNPLVIEAYLEEFPVLNDPRIVKRLVREEVYVRRRLGESPTIAEYQQRFPGIVTESDLEVRDDADSYSAKTVDVGDAIGPYKLLQKLGEGGFGVVYMAEQRQPVRRRVALKVIKPGMDSKAIVARFEAERQALALMEHESIAKVLDAGETQHGRPYFVMELVKGIPITAYCDQHKLSPNDRIDLFIRVCQAIQHAHQKGIIHRDIKPSNILVTSGDDRAIPKVIDFGIAKALEQTLTDKTMFTHYGQVIGTPQYMSPEQADANAVDVDTRSDVYCLGVLLYELLTGTTPIRLEDFRKAALDEMLRLIREGEHEKPSTRISQSGEALTGISDNRQIEPKKLGSLVRGDLDWIVMKALEKDRSRRYETASAFADDMRRYLENEPVMAGPPSAVYRFRKLARKYRAQVATAATIAVLLVAATVTSTMFYVRANRARVAEQAAREAAETAEVAARQQASIAIAVTEFLTEDVLGQADPSATPDRDIKLRTVLDRAARNIEGQFQDQPSVEAAVRGAIGRAYLALGEYDSAEPQLERSSKIESRESGPESEAALDARLLVGELHQRQARYDEAERIYGDVLEAYQQRLGSEHRKTLSAGQHLGDLFSSKGKFKQAEASYLAALEKQERTLGAKHADTLVTVDQLGALYQTLGQYEKANQYCQRALDALRETKGNDHPLTITSIVRLGLLYEKQARFEESEPLLTEAVERSRRVMGERHPTTLSCISNLALLYNSQGLYDKAMQLYETALDVATDVLGENHPSTLAYLDCLAQTMLEQGMFDKAAPLFQKSVDGTRRALGDVHPETITAIVNLASVKYRLGQVDDAAALYRQAIEAYPNALSADHPDRLMCMSNLASLLTSRGKHKEALALCRETIMLKEQALGEDHPSTLTSLSSLGQIYSAMGDHEQAVKTLKQAVEGRTAALHQKHPDTLYSMHLLAGAYAAQRRFDEAEEAYKQVLEFAHETLGPKHMITTQVTNDLAYFYLSQERFEEAEPLYAIAVDQFFELIGPSHHFSQTALRGRLAVLVGLERFKEARDLGRESLALANKHTPDGLEVAYAESLLGAALAGLEEFEQAERLLQSAQEGIEQAHTKVAERIRLKTKKTTEQRLVNLYDKWGKPEEAAKWRESLEGEEGEEGE